MGADGANERTSPAGTAGATRVEATESSPIVLDRNVACVRCSYNLRGLPTNGKCPECSEPIANSTRGFVPRRFSKQYLASMRLGLTMVLIGVPVHVLFSAAPIVAFLERSRYLEAVDFMAAAVGLCSSAILVAGYWCYAVIDADYRERMRVWSVRRVLRIAAVASFVISLIRLGPSLAVMALSEYFPIFYGFVVMFPFGLIICVVVWMFEFVAVMNYTARIGEGVPDDSVVRRARSFRWLLPLMCVIGVVPGLPIMSMVSHTLVWAIFLAGPCAAVVLYWRLLARVRKHIASIQESGMAAELPGRIG